jgi:hypothetical protein
LQQPLGAVMLKLDWARGEWVLELDWAEPGDPRINNFALKGEPPRYRHLAAAPIPKRKAYPTDVPRWIEQELIRRWREDYDEAALNFLVEAYRPKVVNMAQRYVGAKRKLLIEYGMFGLRLAASPQWPNRKRKGTMAGYNPAKARFISYARFQAERLMRDAARGHNWQPPQHLQDTLKEFEEWAKTPIPPEVELACANNPECEPNNEIHEVIKESGAWLRVGQDYDFARKLSPNKRIRQIRRLRSEFGIAHDPWWLVRPVDPCFSIFCTRKVEHMPIYDGSAIWVCWDLPPQSIVCWLEYDKPRPADIRRNYLTHKVTELERENRRKYMGPDLPRTTVLPRMAWADGMPTKTGQAATRTAHHYQWI